jgi:hypothetical protein
MRYLGLVTVTTGASPTNSTGPGVQRFPGRRGLWSFGSSAACARFGALRPGALRPAVTDGLPFRDLSFTFRIGLKQPELESKKGVGSGRLTTLGVPCAPSNEKQKVVHLLTDPRHSPYQGGF